MRRRTWAALGVVAIGAVLLGALVLMAAATQGSARFGSLYVPLLVINAAGLIALLWLIGAQVLRLARQLRRREPGARLTLRLAVLFTALALPPMLVVYGFSLHFLRQGLDRWFDVRIEAALGDALELSRKALELRMRELLRQTQRLAEDVGEQSTPAAPLNLEQLRNPGATVVANTLTPFDLDLLRRRADAEELVLTTATGRLIASSSTDTRIVPNLPPDAALLQLRQGGSYIALEPLAEGQLFARVVVRVPGATGEDARVLQALYRLPSGIDQLADNVEQAAARYIELSYLREKLELGFSMTLTLVLLAAIVIAVWAAFYTARRLAAPVRDLVQGTQAVAAGDYGIRLPVTTRDDIGRLVESFNIMTERLAAARDELRRSRDAIDAQRNYLQAVLERLTSGVLTLDDAGEVRTANAAAAAILGVPMDGLVGHSLPTLTRAHANLRPVWERISARLEARDPEWEEQITFLGAQGRQVLLCRGTRLAVAHPEHSDVVVVFDDITALLQGQRNAAWGEAARRLAHEIKNPLTPIQLAAERLRHKYLPRLEGEAAEPLERLTGTIITQVETLKHMVNAFSDYARAPQLQREPVSLAPLVREVADLFNAGDPRPEIVVDIDPDTPLVQADVRRLRQVLNNLVKNALEATPPGERPRVQVTLRPQPEAADGYVELRVADSGPGLPEEILDQVFDPYVTTKPRGTGLGLAIVRKIVEEHGGVVWIQNRPEGGALVVIRLPVAARAQRDTTNAAAGAQ